VSPPFLSSVALFFYPPFPPPSCFLLLITSPTSKRLLKPCCLSFMPSRSPNGKWFFLACLIPVVLVLSRLLMSVFQHRGDSVFSLLPFPPATSKGTLPISVWPAFWVEFFSYRLTGVDGALVTVFLFLRVFLFMPAAFHCRVVTIESPLGRPTFSSTGLLALVR